jgi:hypothetical protein
MASSSRCHSPLRAAAYGENLYSPVPKLGSPPRHLTLTSSPATTGIDGRRRCAGGGKFPLFWPWAEKSEWAEPVSRAKPSASVD